MADSSHVINSIKKQFLKLDSKSQSELLQALRQTHIKNYQLNLNDDNFLISCIKKQIKNEKSHVVLTDCMIKRVKYIRDLIIKYYKYLRLSHMDNHHWIYMASLLISDEAKTNDTLFKITKLLEEGKLYITVVETIEYPPDEDGSYSMSSSSGDVSIVDIISNDKIYSSLIKAWTGSVKNYNDLLAYAQLVK